MQNGRVIESVPPKSNESHHDARLRQKLTITEPCWLAARVVSTAKNEYGQPLFAHTSPVYVTYKGRTIQQAEDVRYLLGQLDSARSAIAAKAKFDTDTQRDSVLQLYDRAAAELQRRLETK